MTESMPPIPEEMRQLNRVLMEKMLDKACSDPTWKQQLLDDPEAAMQSANFPELRQLQQAEQRARPSQQYEVRGQMGPGGYGGGGEADLTVGTTGGCNFYCANFTMRYWWTRMPRPF